MIMQYGDAVFNFEKWLLAPVWTYAQKASNWGRHTGMHKHIHAAQHTSRHLQKLQTMQQCIRSNHRGNKNWQPTHQKEREKKSEVMALQLSPTALVPLQWCNDENMTSVTACANYAALLWTAHWWQWFLADLLLSFKVQTYLLQPKMFMKLT